jgi:molecular chaperone GrpE
VTEREVSEAKAGEEEIEAQAESVVPMEEVEAVEGVEAGEEEELDKEPGELERLQEELEKANAQASEYLDGWQRAQAEFSNYKKRQEAERAQVMALANATLLRKLLPVVDDFERALETLPTNLSQLTWCEGLLLIRHKLGAILESEGVKPIESDGQAFDPRYHEAVTYEAAPGFAEGQIIGEVQRGYTLGERVLRPALVRVAKAPAVAEPGSPEEE